MFENLLVGGGPWRGLTGARRRRACAEILERLHLLKRANALAGALTLLERKRLEMARALATNPHLLLLDEIAGGLTEGECLELIETIKQVHAAGMTIVWIEHVVHALLAVVGRLERIEFRQEGRGGRSAGGDGFRGGPAILYRSVGVTIPMLETRGLRLTTETSRRCTGSTL